MFHSPYDCEQSKETTVFHPKNIFPANGTPYSVAVFLTVLLLRDLGKLNKLILLEIKSMDYCHKANESKLPLHFFIGQ